MPIHALFEGQEFPNNDVTVKVAKPLNVGTHWDEKRGAHIALANEFGTTVRGEGMTSAEAVEQLVFRATCAQTEEVQIRIAEFLKRVPRETARKA